MLRIFKPRSPMSMGAWALTVFGDLDRGRGRRRPARPPRDGARARRRQRRRRRLPRLLHRRAARLDRRAGVGALAGCSSARSSSAPRRRPAPPPTRLVLVADGLPRRAPDARRARQRRDRRDGGRAGAVDDQRAPARRARRALQQAAGRCSSAAKWLVRAGLGLRSAPPARRPRRAARGLARCTSPPACVPLRLGRGRARRRRATTGPSPRWRALTRHLTPCERGASAVRARAPMLPAWNTPSKPGACASASATPRRWTASTSPSARAPCTACSAPTAPARPPRCASSPPCCGPTRAPRSSPATTSPPSPPGPRADRPHRPVRGRRRDC